MKGKCIIIIYSVLFMKVAPNHARGSHETLGVSHFFVDVAPDGTQPPVLYTENETNSKKLFGIDQYTNYVKDAFHR